MEEHSVTENLEMKLNESAKDFLKKTAKWAYFLSILGYVGMGFIVLAGLFAGTLFSAMGRINPAMSSMGGSFGMVMTVVYLLIAALYFFPVYYLNKFASNAKFACATNDSEKLTLSFQYLKSHYKFIGIMTIVIFSLYFLMIIIAFIGGAAMGSM